MVITESVFIKLLKEYTTIDKSFINTSFKKFKVGGKLVFDIKDSNVAKYLNVNLINIRKRLNNMFTKTKKFIENVDFIKINSNKSNASITYMLNYQCFEKLAMSGDTSKSELVREYFIKLRDFMYEHQSITNKNDLNKYRGYESIYFFAVDERKPDIFKIGRTQDIIQRLRNYNDKNIKQNFIFLLLLK
jgi:phage anti-repressor protein